MRKYFYHNKEALNACGIEYKDIFNKNNKTNIGYSRMVMPSNALIFLIIYWRFIMKSRIDTWEDMVEQKTPLSDIKEGSREFEIMKKAAENGPAHPYYPVRRREDAGGGAGDVRRGGL